MARRSRQRDSENIKRGHSAPCRPHRRYGTYGLLDRAPTCLIGAYRPLETATLACVPTSFLKIIAFCQQQSLSARGKSLQLCTNARKRKRASRKCVSPVRCLSKFREYRDLWQLLASREDEKCYHKNIYCKSN